MAADANQRRRICARGGVSAEWDCASIVHRVPHGQPAPAYIA